MADRQWTSLIRGSTNGLSAYDFARLTWAGFVIPFTCRKNAAIRGDKVSRNDDNPSKSCLENLP